MPIAQDIIMLPTLQKQFWNTSLQGWEWSSWDIWDEITTSGDPSWLPTSRNNHYKIPNHSNGHVLADRPWNIRGEFAAPGGTWVLKVKVGDSDTDFVEYTPTLQDGYFELTLPGIGVNKGVWVWYSLYTHTPAGPGGIIRVHNNMRVFTAD